MNENKLNNKLGNHPPEEDFDIPATETMSAWSRSTDTTAQSEISQADILVVEESEQASELLRRTLVGAGYTVSIAHNGEQGLQAARMSRPALIMSDINMPMMNGYQLCRAIKNDETLWSVPLILLTVLSEPEDIIEAINSGADAYIVKPFFEANLLERIRALLDTPIERPQQQERRGEVVAYGGKHYVISAGGKQVLNLMLSLYENMLNMSRELVAIQTEPNLVNENLDGQIRERTTALQISESRFRNLVETANDWIWEVDEQAVFTYTSPRVQEVLGYLPEEVIGKPLFDLMPAEEAQRVAKLFGDNLSLRKPLVNLENVNLHKDGHRVVLETSGVPIIGQDGKLHGYRGIDRDITRRKQAEEALYGIEKKYRKLFESSRDALMVLKPPSWRFTDANQATLDMFGATSIAEFTALGPWNVSSEQQPDGRLSVDAAPEMIATALSRGSHAFEWTHRRLKGKPFAAEVLLTRMEEEGQQYLQATVRDITERKRVELALAESENQIKAIFNAVQDGILVADAQTKRFRMANAAICGMLGYSLDELLNLGVEGIHPAADLPEAIRQFEALLNGETGLVLLPVQRADGVIFPAEITSSVVTLGDRRYLIGVFRDIADRKRAERAEEQACRDSLTELYNHHAFYDLLKDEIYRTQHTAGSVSLLMLDIDFFKHINDSHGHQAGDNILKSTSELLLKQARNVDRVCRYGGDEIAIILPDTQVATARTIATRLCAAVESHSFDISDGKRINITVSIGVAAYPQQGVSLETLVKEADLALYAAKQDGRNCVCCSEVV
ncbi:MAG: PAS domain S-box protein [Candidatus Thiodiazotropha sp.]